MEPQAFVGQPREDGMYEIAKWNQKQNQYISVPNEVFATLEAATERARELNKEHEDYPG